MICWKIGKVKVGTHAAHIAGRSSALWTRQFGERQLLYSVGEEGIELRDSIDCMFMAHMTRISSLNKMDLKTKTVL